MKKIVPQNAVLIPDNAQKVFAGKLFDVYQWSQPLFDGSTATFEMLRRTDKVQIIAIKDSTLVVINEEQPHGGSRKVLPGGRVDPTDNS